MREKRDWGAADGRFSIDFPGIGIVTAEDDGEQEELEEVMYPRPYRQDDRTVWLLAQNLSLLRFGFPLAFPHEPPYVLEFGCPFRPHTPRPSFPARR